MNEETAQLIAIGDIDPISKEKFIDVIEEEETKNGEASWPLSGNNFMVALDPNGKSLLP
jgi:hypothetical protein